MTTERVIAGIAVVAGGYWLLTGRNPLEAVAQAAGGASARVPLASTPIPQTGLLQAPTALDRTRAIVGTGLAAAGTVAGLTSGGATTAGAVGAATGGEAAAAGGSGWLASTGGFLATNPVGWAILGGVGATAVVLAVTDNHNDHRDQINETLRSLGETYVWPGDTGPLVTRPDYAAPGPNGASWASDGVPGTFWLLSTIVAGTGDASTYYAGLSGAKDDDMLKAAFQQAVAQLARQVNNPGANRDPRAAGISRLTLDTLTNSRHDWVRDRTREVLGTGSGPHKALEGLR